jgi:hypothetical protein
MARLKTSAHTERLFAMQITKQMTQRFLLLVALNTTGPLWAFDDDRTINKISLDKENFLDIKANQPRKSLQYQWFDATNGARVFGGSIDHNHLYVLSEYKFQSDLSKYLTTRIQSNQEVFYAIKPVPFPILDIQVFPWAKDIGISLLGTTPYDKRQADLGTAISWGRRPWNFTRLSWIRVDSEYDRKNDFDDTYYRKHPTTSELEGAYIIQNKHIVRYSIALDSPLEFITPQTQGNFKQQGYRYDLLYDYQLNQQELVGITFRGFQEEKSSDDTELHQDQNTVFTTVDVYWADLDRDKERRLGLQLDALNNRFNDYVDAENSLEYSLETVQLYGTHRFPYGPQMAWDFGVHLAWAMEEKLFTPPASADEHNNSFQGKFRTSFEYFALDRKSFFAIQLSLELDSLFKSPLNGGGASFQKVF